VDNQHKKIAGYRDLSEAEVARMNTIKAMARGVGVMLKELADAARVDGDRAAARYVAIAREDLEKGFMFAVKAVARPTDDLGALEL
jgi:hypothetical protein